SENHSSDESETSNLSNNNNNLRNLKVPRLSKEFLKWDSSWPKKFSWIYREVDAQTNLMFCHWYQEAGKLNSFTSTQSIEAQADIQTSF
ncbi:472_t:CDS:2, partial [Racocetra persica]